MAAEEAPTHHRSDAPVLLSLPFRGRWLARNSPARRVPSHGTEMFGESHAIDFVGVDERHRTAGVRDWGTFFGSEPPDRFVVFGQPLLVPGAGTVVAVHDAEPDHEARRSQLTLLSYVLGQAKRAGRGVSALAGNHVTVALDGTGACVLLAHCRAGSVRVAPGEHVAEGQHVADCGNSGNSTQPHVHLQVMDGPDPTAARGVPMAFRGYRVWPSRSGRPRAGEPGMPGEGAVVGRSPESGPCGRTWEP